MKIIDNFLDTKTYIDLVKVIMEARFPWNFVNGKSEIRDGDFQFTHLFVDDGGKIVSPYYKILFPLLKKMNPEKITVQVFRGLCNSEFFFQIFSNWN